MPSAETRALSIQAQMALELLAAKVGDIAARMMAAQVGFDERQVKELADRYEVLIAGAVAAAAGIRAGYIDSVAQLAGERIAIPWDQLARPDLSQVLARGDSPRGAVFSAVTHLRDWVEQDAQKAAEAAGEALTAAREQATTEQAAAVLEERSPEVKAEALLREYADSTVMAASDYADRVVMLPARNIVALRRVAHPRACDRCLVVSKVLVFKENPALRHPQCKCSFEPVFINDADYQGRLDKYRANAGFRGGGDYGRDRRSRGRTQLSDASWRENSEFLQRAWREYLTEEQTRLASMVKSVKSNTFRDWAVMVSANVSEAGGDFLPVITRD